MNEVVRQFLWSTFYHTNFVAMEWGQMCFFMTMMNQFQSATASIVGGFGFQPGKTKSREVQNNYSKPGDKEWAAVSVKLGSYRSAV